MTGCAGRFGGIRRRLRKLGFECIALPASGETLDASVFDHVVNGTVVGTSITGTGLGGAESSQVAYGDCSVVFSTANLLGNRSGGLSHIDTNQSYTTIDFGIYLSASFVAQSELGAFGAWNAFALGDEFKIDVTAGVVTFWRRTPPGAWALIAPAVAAPVFPLRFDSYWDSAGASLAGITLAGFTNNRRVASALDFARRNKTFAMAFDYRRPAFIAGDPCWWRFELARADALNGPVLPLGPGGTYTAVLVTKLNTLPIPAGGFALYGNGSVFADGPSIIVEGGGAISTKAYHWGPNVTATLHVPSDLLLHSSVVRYDGANLLSRFDGADAAPAAIAAPAAPTVESTISAANSAGVFPSDQDLGLFAWAPRSLSAAELSELSDLMDDGWADKTERLVDGNMEAAGVAAWPAIDANCTSAKAAPGHSGTQCLRVTTVVPVGFAAAIQGNVWPQGMRVRMRGWARGDGLGVSVPVMYLSGALFLWAGTNSNLWQPFDVTFTAAYANNRLDLGTTQLSGYVEFDDLMSEQVL